VAYTPHKVQAEAHKAFLIDGYKKGVLYWGRQCGKSIWSIQQLVFSAILNQGQHFIVFKEYQQAEQVAWTQYLHTIPQGLIAKTDKSSLTITFNYIGTNANGDKAVVKFPEPIGERVIEHDESKPPSSIRLLGSDKYECFDDKVEILTSSGWKLFKDLDKTEEVLTLSPTGFAEWQKPTRYIDEYYNGEMYHINSGRIDLSVTPNHRFLVQSGKGVMKFKAISDPTILGYKIPAVAKFEGKDSLSHNDMAIMGFYLAEGNAYGNNGGDITKRRGNYEVVFNQTAGVKGGDKGEVRSQFKKILESAGYNVHEKSHCLYVLNKDLWSKLVVLGNTYTKRIPREYKEQSPDKLRTMLHWLIMGDGTIRGVKRTYSTTSKGLADDVQEIAIKAGYGARIVAKEPNNRISYIKGRTVKSKATLYTITILNNKWSYFTSSKKSYVSKTHYDGRVYCVQVPNQTIMVRNNGKATWSGNSHRGAKAMGMIMDEYQDQDPKAWASVYSKFFATTNGWVCYMGTAKDIDHWNELLDLSEKSDNYYYSKATYRDTPYISQEWVDEDKKDAIAKGELGIWMQEMELVPFNIQGVVYPMFDKNIHIVKPSDVPVDGTDYITVDFGFAEGHPAAVCFVRITADDVWYVYDEIHGTGIQIDDMIAQIREKTGDRRITAIIADSARPDLIDYMQSKGLPVIPAPKKSNSVPAGIQLLAQRLQPKIQIIGEPRPNMYFASNCKRTVYDFTHYKYKEIKANRPAMELPEKRFDDATDSIRYLALFFKYGQVNKSNPINAKPKFNEFGL